MAQLRKNRYASFYDASMDDETLDNELATATSDGLMAKEDKIKLDSIKVTDTEGVKIPASNIVPDEDNQFVSGKDKTKLDSLDVNEDGSIEVSADNVKTTKDKQFITETQIKKLESAASIEYNAEDEAFIFL